jgi:hypothetical protein
MALEGRDRLLSVSIGHCFLYGDVPECGARILVLTDDAKSHGDRLAEQIGRELISFREHAAPPAYSVDGAIDFALAAPGGVKLSPGLVRGQRIPRLADSGEIERGRTQFALQRIAGRLVEAGRIDHQRGDIADQLARPDPCRIGQRIEAAQWIVGLGHRGDIGSPPTLATVFHRTAYL